MRVCVRACSSACTGVCVRARADEGRASTKGNRWTEPRPGDPPHERVHPDSASARQHGGVIGADPDHIGAVDAAAAVAEPDVHDALQQLVGGCVGVRAHEDARLVGRQLLGRPAPSAPCRATTLDGGRTIGGSGRDQRSARFFPTHGHPLHTAGQHTPVQNWTKTPVGVTRAPIIMHMMIVSRSLEAALKCLPWGTGRGAAWVNSVWKCTCKRHTSVSGLLCHR